MSQKSKCHWSKSEIHYLKVNYPTVEALDQLASKLGRSKKALINMACRLGLKRTIRPARPRQNVHKRFWSKVQKTDSCWNWTAQCGRSGYGQFRFNDYPHQAHRVAWILSYGPIPPEKFVCHRCDNRKCVNPEHLFLGTCADNLADMAAKGRSTRGTKSASAKLTEQDVRDIRNYYQAGQSQRQIAAQFGVSSHAIYSILAGKTWAWLV